jgi:hypothetical protein
MLCNSALRAYEKYGVVAVNNTGVLHQRGLLVNYESLPGAIPKVMLPMFGKLHTRISISSSVPSVNIMILFAQESTWTNIG